MQIDFVNSIHAISASEWNGLINDDYPFVRHEFFAALEDSGSTTAASGWQAHHLVLRDQGELIAALPLFIKNHSYGEYVFDWAWADAYQRYGERYYPKLVSAIPFTPCYGTRLLLSSHTSVDDCLPSIVEALQKHAFILGASSWHCLFPTVDLSSRLNDLGVRTRLGCQFHWFNHGYADFDDFLAQMSSRKRKNINKERRQLAQQEFTFLVKEGSDISADDWDFFAQLYQLTYLKRSGHTGYLKRDFFHLLGQRLPENIVLIIAQRHGQAVAASLYLRDTNTLYGRYWGCREEFEFLHFETCYYQGIDYAIAHGLQRFDGGAQGEHKIQRGFEPIVTRSNHWIANTDFSNAINDFMRTEESDIKAYQKAAQNHLPFKKSTEQ